MKNKLKSKNVRIIISILIPIICLLGVIYAYFRGSPFFCVFHELTGLLCFGCGSGRALTALLHFDIIRAMQCNIIFVLTSPIVTYYLVVEYINYARGKKIIKNITINTKIAGIMAVVLIIFVILRNIPHEFFTFLRP